MSPTFFTSFCYVSKLSLVGSFKYRQLYDQTCPGTYSKKSWLILCLPRRLGGPISTLFWRLDTSKVILTGKGLKVYEYLWANINSELKLQRKYRKISLQCNAQQYFHFQKHNQVMKKKPYNFKTIDQNLVVFCYTTHCICFRSTRDPSFSSIIWNYENFP